LDKVFDAAEKAEATVRKMAADNPALFKKAFPNDSVDTVIASMQRFSLQAEDQAMIKALKDINKELEEMGKQQGNAGLRTAEGGAAHARAGCKNSV
jgi:hypothetical protein